MSIESRSGGALDIFILAVSGMGDHEYTGMATGSRAPDDLIAVNAR